MRTGSRTRAVGRYLNGPSLLPSRVAGGLARPGAARATIRHDRNRRSGGTWIALCDCDSPTPSQERQARYTRVATGLIAKVESPLDRLSQQRLQDGSGPCQRGLRPRRRRRPCLGPCWKVADIFREHGPAWRDADRGHVSLDQLKVMSAIEHCRTAALGGHVARCENAACGHTVISYNSCRDRHCPKCQAAASRQWLAEREAELLPVPTSTSSTRCRRSCATSPIRTSAWSTASS
jgi:hypothetical protein